MRESNHAVSAAAPRIVAGLTAEERYSISFADADGWRCFYPLARGHLTAAEARAMMRKERGQPAETREEADAAEWVLLLARIDGDQDAYEAARAS